MNNVLKQKGKNLKFQNNLLNFFSSNLKFKEKKKKMNEKE